MAGDNELFAHGGAVETAGGRRRLFFEEGLSRPASLADLGTEGGRRDTGRGQPFRNLLSKPRS